MKAVIRRGVADALYLSHLHRLCHKGKVIILTYHRVVPRQELTDQWIQAGMYVDTHVFEQQMRFLREQFHVVSLQEVLEQWKGGEWDRTKRYCVVTFDDGWLDNYRYAYPILRKFDLPATIFLPTDFVGTNEWFWPEKVAYCVKEMTGNGGACSKKGATLKRVLNIDDRETRLACVSESARRNFADQVIERCKHIGPEMISGLIGALSQELGIVLPGERCIVNWDEVARMAENRISFGSHSCSHRILTHLSMEDVKSELEVSQQLLKSRSKNYVPVFCYPNGNNDSRIQALVKECGYQAAVGVRPGFEGERPGQMFELRRVGIHNDIAFTVPLYSMRLCAPLIA